MLIGITNLAGANCYKGKNSNSEEIIQLATTLNEINGVICNIFSTKPVVQETKKVTFDLFADPEEEEVKEENATPFLKYIQDEDPKKYDAIFIMNTSINCFGGVLDIDTAKFFMFLNKAENAKIYYVFNDANLTFNTLEKVVGARLDKLTNGEFIKDVKDIHFEKPIEILTDFYDCIDWVKKANSKNGVVNNVHVYKTANEFIYQGYEDKFVKNKAEFDLIYGGSFRSGAREDSFNEYLMNQPDLKVAIYGTIKRNKLCANSTSEPKMLGKVKCTEVVNTNARGFATIIVPEKHYENFITRRVFESILAGCVVFIDKDFDKKRVVSPDDDFIYVSSGKELSEKIQKLKTDKALYNKIIKNQLDFLKKESKYNNKAELEKILNLK